MRRERLRKETETLIFLVSCNLRQIEKRKTPQGDGTLEQQTENPDMRIKGIRTPSGVKRRLL